MNQLLIRLLIGIITFGLGSLVVSFSSSFSTPQVPSQSIESFTTPNRRQLDGKYDFYQPPPPEIKPEEEKELTCRDRRILPVWRIIKRDIDLRDSWSIEERDCANLFEAKYLDLNADGTKEIIVWGPPCGGVGNCAFWIFQKKSRGYTTILSLTDYIDASEMGDQIKKSQTNGYLDILLKGHMNARDTNYTTYKFDGRRYRQARSLIRTSNSEISGRPQWKFVSEDEYEKMYPEMQP